MIDPEVRRAEPADADQLRFLESVARRALVDQRGGQRWLATNPERGTSWEGVIASSSVFVAYIDAVVVGYLVATRRGDVLEVDEVFVLEEARELGFGDELLAAALADGRASGMRLLEAEALPGDRNTKNLYERAGIKARLITVSTEL
jgi:GNAT superfamily N-acetyltransferase